MSKTKVKENEVSDIFLFGVFFSWRRRGILHFDEFCKYGYTQFL
ncbi:hypothetical protein pah_c047o029 [Parachlamydia acanthamoebae str. Hall's coccus]|nr:hypothetical protein pah_c047o029 [Parachlamydia acanthamoebae str. Hall's coccus]